MSITIAKLNISRIYQVYHENRFKPVKKWPKCSSNMLWVSPVKRSFIILLYCCLNALHLNIFYSKKERIILAKQIACNICKPWSKHFLLKRQVSGIHVSFIAFCNVTHVILVWQLTHDQNISKWTYVVRMRVCYFSPWLRNSDRMCENRRY